MRTTAAGAGLLNATLAWSRRRLRLPFVAGLSGCVLLGCAAEYSQQGNSTPAKSAIPLPNQALLTPHPEPGCALKTFDLDSDKGQAPGEERKPTKVANLADGARSRLAMTSDGAPSVPGTAAQPNPALVQTNPDASLAERVKLEYERDCLRRAEARVREKLAQLQSAVRKTARAVRRTVSNAP